jgi:hypothetical protein
MSLTSPALSHLRCHETNGDSAKRHETIVLFPGVVVLSSGGTDGCSEVEFDADMTLNASKPYVF